MNNNVSIVRDNASKLTAIVLIFSPLVSDLRAGPPQPLTPMCVLFRDLPTDRVKSDGADYCDLEDPDVHAYSVGGFALSTRNANNANGLGSRMIGLDFGTPIQVFNAAAVPASGLFDALLHLDSVNDQNGNYLGGIPQGVLTMKPGNIMYTGVMIQFTVNGFDYELHFGRTESGSAQTGPRTPLLLTARENFIPDPNGCSDRWTLETVPLSGGQSAWAYLIRITPVGKKLAAQNIGAFYMPFALAFEKK